MAANRNRLAAALAYEQERRKRMAEFVPTPSDGTMTTDQGNDLATNLQNLSSGLGRGLTTQLQGLKGIVTDPVGSAKAGYEAVKGIVRDPSVLAEALRQTGQRAMSGPLGVGEVIGEMAGPMRGKPTMAEIDVYHGSPHRFEEFDASKIGTGEGAQAYGHGIYLAESPKVAKGYASTLAENANPTVGGKPYDSKNPAHIAAVVINDAKALGLGDDYAYEQARYTLNSSAVPKADRPVYQKALALLDEGAQLPKVERSSGNLYTADLPDEMVDRMLDWDKPLSEQPALIKTAEQIKNNYLKMDDPIENFSGQNLYEFLVYKIGPAAAAKKLEELGIPGIKYLDQQSRPTNFPEKITRNFVVFPGEEKKVKILKRE